MRRILSLFVVFAGLAVGCDRNSTDVIVQDVPKQPRPAMMTSAAPDERPIHWIVPEGWREVPGASMRFATFLVNEDPKVELTVVPLPGDSGGLLANVNRWEGQLGLKPSTEQELSKSVTRIEVDNHPVDVVDLMGPEANPRLRMLGALIAHEGRTWYFKMSGPAAVIEQQKGKFDGFVKSIHFASQTEEAKEEQRTAKPQAAVENASGISYSVPEGWSKSLDRPMRVLTLTVGSAPQQAEMIASKFPVNSGSVLENFKRWRGQVGLPPISKPEDQQTKPVTVGGADGVMLDLAGPQNRMLVAWVTRGNDWWFFKLTGPAAVIEKQQAAFEAFLKSVKFTGDSGEPKT
jgi:hypothetical protein